jgi:hypothetical protein
LGKSVISSQLIKQYQIPCFFFCRDNNAENRAPSHVLRTFAYQLATKLDPVTRRYRYPWYRTLLLRAAQKLDSNGNMINWLVQSLSEQIEKFFVEPFVEAELEGTLEEIIWLIDATDELTFGADYQALFNAFTLSRLPRWVRIMITSRNEPVFFHLDDTTDPLTVYSFQVDKSLDINKEDIRSVAKVALLEKVYKLSKDQVKLLKVSYLI